MILYNTGILFNIRSEYDEAVKSLELSISKNPENVYAYLALGDAYERQDELAKALNVYLDLKGLGIKVHGLKEKIALSLTRKLMVDHAAQSLTVTGNSCV